MTGIVKDGVLCEKISSDYKNRPIIFWQSKKGKIAVHSIEGADTKEILENVINKLPNPEFLDAEDFKVIPNYLYLFTSFAHVYFQDIRTRLRDTSKDEKPWLFCFYLGAATELNLQLKRLPALIPNIKIGKR